MTVVDLDWPYEGARPPETVAASGAGYLVHRQSNLVLDLHGDPQAANLVVFSDGNHHMALEMACRAFYEANPDVGDIFYTTTPPAPLIAALDAGQIRLGNLLVTVKPHVFIGPADVIGKLAEGGKVSAGRPFAKSRGCALLVRRGNPLGISGVADLFRPDVRLCCSNPETEKASFTVYANTLSALATAERDPDDGEAVVRLMMGAGGRTAHSQVIHHREVPELLATDRADVAPVYHHLALRYRRIFPDVFDIVPLIGPNGGGTADDPQPGPEHDITIYHVGLRPEPGDWGRAFADHMCSAKVADIYRHHGLQPAYSGAA